MPRPGDFSVFSEIEKTGKSPGLGQNEDKTSIGTGYNEPKVHPVTILVLLLFYSRPEVLEQLQIVKINTETSDYNTRVIRQPTRELNKGSMTHGL